VSGDLLGEAAESIGKSWSGSWIGYHATVHLERFRGPQPGEMFDPEWGFLEAMANRTIGPWNEYTRDSVEQAILTRAGNPSSEKLAEGAKALGCQFDSAKLEILSSIDAFLSTGNDSYLEEVREAVDKLDSHLAAADYLEAIRPKHMVSRDSAALMQGMQVPVHISYQCWLLEQSSYAVQAEKLADIARQCHRYLEKRAQVGGKTMNAKISRIFIGHGASTVWRELKDFLVGKLGLE